MLNPTVREKQMGKSKLFRIGINETPLGQFAHLEKLPPAKRAVFSLLNFKGKNLFYASKTDHFNSLCNDVATLDPMVALGLVDFMTNELKLRTSPAVVLGVIAATYYHVSRVLSADRENEFLLEDERVVIRKLFNKWFTRPDMVADILYTFSNITGESFKKIPKFIKKVIKERLETFDKKSLVKKRLDNRDIKLADMIKVFRPKPATVEQAKLFKDIIENKARVSDAEFISVQSSSKLTKEKKQEITKKMMKDDVQKVKSNEKKFNIPINALIRNLNTLSKEQDKEVIESIAARLNSVDAAIVNPFDLLIEGVNPALETAINNLLNRYFDSLGDVLPGKTDFILDISGSMYFAHEGIKTAVKYLVLLAYLASKTGNLNKLFLFSSRLYTLDKPQMILKSIEHTKDIIGTYEQLYQYLISPKVQHNYVKGTALISSYTKYKSEHQDEDVKNVIILSDEMTWADQRLDYMYRDLSLSSKQNYLFVNPVSYNLSPFTARPNILRFAGINPMAFKFIDILFNFDQFLGSLRNRVAP